MNEVYPSNILSFWYLTYQYNGSILVHRAMNKALQLNRSKYLCPEDRDYLYTMPIADGPEDFTDILVCNCGYSTDDISTFKTPRPLLFAPWHYQECDKSRVCICDDMDDRANN